MGAAESKKKKKEKNKSLKSKSKNETKKELKNEPKNEPKNDEPKIGEPKNDDPKSYDPKNDAIDEVITGSKPIPLKIANKVTKAVCKIIIETNGGINHGTGFFLNYSESKKFLMTCYHVINPSLENRKITLEIHNQKIFRKTKRYGNDRNKRIR